MGPHKLFDKETGNAVSEIINTRRFRNKRGLFYLFWENRPAGAFDLQLEVSPDMVTWTDYAVFDERDPVGAKATYAEAVFHFPFVRATLTNNTGAEVSVWYIE